MLCIVMTSVLAAASAEEHGPAFTMTDRSLAEDVNLLQSKSSDIAARSDGVLGRKSKQQRGCTSFGKACHAFQKCCGENKCRHYFLTYQPKEYHVPVYWATAGWGAIARVCVPEDWEYGTNCIDDDDCLSEKDPGGLDPWEVQPYGPEHWCNRDTNTCTPPGTSYAGAPCTHPNQCGSRICVDGTCISGELRQNDPCTHPDQCRTMNCVDGRCGVGERLQGRKCTKAYQCLSDSCVDNTCAGAECESAQDCPGDDIPYWCDKRSGTATCVPRTDDGSSCEVSNQCWSRNCKKNVCTRKAAGMACAAKQECKTNYCYNGKCSGVCIGDCVNYGRACTPNPDNCDNTKNLKCVHTGPPTGDYYCQPKTRFCDSNGCRYY